MAVIVSSVLVVEHLFLNKIKALIFLTNHLFNLHIFTFTNTTFIFLTITHNNNINIPMKSYLYKVLKYSETEITLLELSIFT